MDLINCPILECFEDLWVVPLVFIIVMAIEPMYEPHRKSEEPLYDELPERRRAALVVADYSDLAFVFLL